MRLSALITAVFALAVSGCATTGGAAGSNEFHAAGEIHCRFSGASFNAHEVRGPKISVSQRPDGTWGGLIETSPLDATFYPDGSFKGGMALRMKVVKADNVLTITGQWRGRIFRFEVSPTQLMVRTDTRSMDFPLTNPGTYGGFGEVQFTGDAAKAPATPEFALALVAAFI